MLSFECIKNEKSVYFLLTSAEMSIKHLILNLLFWENVGLSHMWYMPMILGIYLFIPFLSNLVAMFTTKIWVIIIGVVFLYSFVGTVANILFQLKFGINLNISNPVFMGGYYGIYVVLGYFVKSGLLKNIKSRYLLLISVLCFFITVFFQIYVYDNNIEYSVWYNYPFIIICALDIFIIISRCGNKLKINSSIYNDISKCAFGIFLVHNMIIQVIRKYFSMDRFLSIRMFELWLIVFGISYLIVKVLCKNKNVGRYLFLIKK